MTAPTDTPEALREECKRLASAYGADCELGRIADIETSWQSFLAALSRLAALAAASAASLVAEPADGRAHALADIEQLLTEAFSDAESLGHGLSGRSALARSSASKRELLDAIRYALAAPLPASPAQPVVAASETDVCEKAISDSDRMDWLAKHWMQRLVWFNGELDCWMSPGRFEHSTLRDAIDACFPERRSTQEVHQ